MRRRSPSWQRARILGAVVEVVAERGVGDVSVGLVVARASVSRRAFYECFDGLQECLVAVLDGALERAVPLVVEAFAGEGAWQDGMRRALAGMLAFFDEEPALARVCLVELFTAAPVLREHRERVLGVFAGIVIQRIGGEVSHASPLAAEGAYASVVGIVGARLVARERPPLLELLGPLMGVIVGPFMDGARVAEEVRRGDELAREMSEGRSRGVGVGVVGGVRVPDVLLSARAHRARLCLLYVVDHPGVSNRQVASGIGALHREQVSRLLGRLAVMGLLVKCVTGPGRPNAWSATPEGERVALALAR
jgi:AcrR family transcriptional regulator